MEHKGAASHNLHLYYWSLFEWDKVQTVHSKTGQEGPEDGKEA